MTMVRETNLSTHPWSNARPPLRQAGVGVYDTAGTRIIEEFDFLRESLKDIPPDEQSFKTTSVLVHFEAPCAEEAEAEQSPAGSIEVIFCKKQLASIPQGNAALSLVHKALLYYHEKDDFIMKDVKVYLNLNFENSRYTDIEVPQWMKTIIVSRKTGEKVDEW